MAHRTVPSWLVVATFLLSACTDKAQPDYAKCVQADSAGDLQGAWSACNAAVAADPNSTSGKAAATKLAEMRPKHNASQAPQGASTDKAANEDDDLDPEDKAILARMEREEQRRQARAEQRKARAEQRKAQAQAGLVGSPPTTPSPAAPTITCKPAPEADGLCVDNGYGHGYSCTGGTVEDVKKQGSGCQYFGDGTHFCCERPPP
jgi:hypothetical protein